MTYRHVVVCTLVAILAWGPLPSTEAGDEKTRINIVSSYHREYLWSQETNTGVITAMLEFGYLDDDRRGVQYTRDDYVESSRADIKNLWMDTKRKNSREQIEHTVKRIVTELEQFEPGILLLGDDNAANYIGKQYIYTELPVVFGG